VAELTPEEAAKAAEKLGELMLKKAAAFDAFTAWLSEQVDGPIFTTAMDPDWIVDTLKTRMAMTLEAAGDKRAARRRRNGIARNRIDYSKGWRE
jgi:hypothetical protein